MDRHSSGRRYLAVLAALLSACATNPHRMAGSSGNEEQVQAWLVEAPREVAVKVSAELPAGSVQVWDSKTGERVGKGVVGAGAGAAQMLIRGCFAGPAGCVVGAIFAPVGAVAGGVAGAVSVQSVTHAHALSEAGGAPELYASSVDTQLAARLAGIVVDESRAYFASRSYSEDPGPVSFRSARKFFQDAGDAPFWFVRPRQRHTLVASETPAPGQGELAISVTALDLLGDTGDDPRVALVLEAQYSLASPGARATWSGFVYRGAERRISEWRHDDGAAFRAELDNALRALARDIVTRF
jgi:hypothetical protein